MILRVQCNINLTLNLLIKTTFSVSPSGTRINKFLGEPTLEHSTQSSP